MFNLIKKIKEDKKIYKEHLAMVHSLPEDYQFVFYKMNEYIWSFAGGSGLDVREIIGADAAGFCDELIRDDKSWMDSRRKRLNNDITKNSHS